jgi:cobalamin biosynthetic protein CobC
MLEHGGRVRRAAIDFAIPLQAWLDLSAAINPLGWPVPVVPQTVWNRLPEVEDGLEAAARDYYGVDALLAVAGSQVAIQALPHLRRPCRVGLLENSYNEHRLAWSRAGHRIVPLVGWEGIEQQLTHLDVLVLVRPNNPTGVLFPLDRLLAWHAALVTRGGWLLVDEAFIDATPHLSLLSHARPGLIVLRSLGKFFGLAGARVGFIHGQVELLSCLAQRLGPWSISGPARWIAKGALADKAWQAETRLRLTQLGTRLHDLLSQYRLKPDGGCALFQWVLTPQAAAIHQFLARHGILTRLYNQPHSLRFGLPGREVDWHRLQKALEAYRWTHP